MSTKPALTCDKSHHPYAPSAPGRPAKTCQLKMSYMGRSSGDGQEQNGSTEAAGAAHNSADTRPIGGRHEKGARGRDGIRREPAPSARFVDRDEFVAKLAARHGATEPAAAAAVRIAEALRATAAEYPDLTDDDAIAALRAIEDGVRRAGVPRRRG